MGGKCPHRKVKKRRFSHKTARRTKFLLKGDDAVYEELMKLTKSEGAEAKPLPLDEDLPGMGQFYCLHCDRYFASAEVRDDHLKTKLHKKRCAPQMGVTTGMCLKWQKSTDRLLQHGSPNMLLIPPKFYSRKEQCPFAVVEAVSIIPLVHVVFIQTLRTQRRFAAYTYLDIEED